MKIRDLMRVEVVTAAPDLSAKDAFETMRKGGFRHLPVVDAHGKIAGIISDRDIRNVAVFFDKKPSDPSDYHLAKTVLVREVMTKNPVTVAPDDDVSRAAELMAKHHYGCLPVAENGKLVGILTRSDMMTLLAKILSDA